MKNHIVKQMVSFTAVMSLCAVILAGSGNPFGGTPDPDGKGRGPIVTIGNPSDPSDGEGSGQEPGAQPQDNQDPELEKWE